MSCPASATWPASARSSPASTAISELLPDPDGPSTATLSPGSSVRLTAFQNFGADIALRRGSGGRRARSIRGSVMARVARELAAPRQWRHLGGHDPPVDCRRPSVDQPAGASAAARAPAGAGVRRQPDRRLRPRPRARLRAAAAGDAAPPRHRRDGRRRRRVGRHQRGGQARLGWTLDGLPRKPDLVIVELGANDMLRGLDPALTERNLDAMLAELERRKIPVLLAGMRAAPNLDPAYVARFEAIYPDAGRAGMAPRSIPSSSTGSRRQQGMIQADGMHPTFAGVKRIVTGITPAVKQALGSALGAQARRARSARRIRRRSCCRRSSGPAHWRARGRAGSARSACRLRTRRRLSAMKPVSEMLMTRASKPSLPSSRTRAPISTAMARRAPPVGGIAGLGNPRLDHRQNSSPSATLLQRRGEMNANPPVAHPAHLPGDRAAVKQLKRNAFRRYAASSSQTHHRARSATG